MANPQPLLDTAAVRETPQSRFAIGWPRRIKIFKPAMFFGTGLGYVWAYIRGSKTNKSEYVVTNSPGLNDKNA